MSRPSRGGRDDEERVALDGGDDDEEEEEESSDAERGSLASRYVSRRFVSHIGPDALLLRRLVDESQDRQYMYLPRTWHSVLTMALWISLAVIFLPGLYLWKSQAWAYTTFMVPQAILASFFLAQSLFRSEVDEVVTERGGNRVYYWKSTDRATTLLRWGSILSTLFAATFLGLLVWGTGFQCPGYTNLNLYEETFGVSCVDQVDINTLNRMPYFGSLLGFAELCLDAFAISVFVMVVGAFMVFLDIACALYQWRMCIWSEEIHRAFAVHEPVLDLVEQEGGGDGEAVDAFVKHIQKEVQGAAYVLGPTNTAFEARMKKER